MSFFHKSKWEQFKNKISLSSFLVGVLLTALFFSLGTVFLTGKKDATENSTKKPKKITDMIIKPVSAAEIYPEFVCGCCGKPLDPDNICCGDMKSKIEYIDKLIDEGLSRDEIMMKATKEFGIDALAKSETKKRMKDQLLANAPKNAAKIAIESTTYDFGKVSQADGVVTTLFNFTNEGESDLIIDKLNTSCGCTSASIVYKGEEGPIFRMDMGKNTNPTDWSVSIAPGDDAQLKVIYDPNKHGPQKQDVMSITRTVSLFSNDPVEFEKKVNIEMEQVR